MTLDKTLAAAAAGTVLAYALHRPRRQVRRTWPEGVSSGQRACAAG